MGDRLERIVGRWLRPGASTLWHAPDDIAWLVGEVRRLRRLRVDVRVEDRQELVRVVSMRALDYAASTPISPEWERGASWVLDVAARVAEGATVER